METNRDIEPQPAPAVFAGAGVFVDPEARVQLARVAALPGCRRAVGMPDLHPGRGIPVGAAFAFEGVLYPELIGGDAGCGARVVATSLPRPSLDALERRLREGLDEDPLRDVDPVLLVRAVVREGARALAWLPGVPEPLAALAAVEPAEDLGPAVALGSEAEEFAGMLGTVGGGNHFAEISLVSSVEDAEVAAGLGLARGRVVVVAHSGSRGMGGWLGRRFHEPLSAGSPEAEAYLALLAGCRRFARANRFVLAYRLLRALSAARPGRLRGAFDVVHNDVVREPLEGRAAWVHRKGAAPARAGEPTVLLGSRGAPSWVLWGRGEEQGLSSVAHGAGRRLGRNDARERLKARYRKAELTRTRLGGRVICDDADLLFEEHPEAYKPVEPVLASVVEAGLASKVAALEPLVTVKR